MSNTILLIDDDSRHAELLRSYLQRFNLEMHHAEDAESGLKMLSELKPDLLLLDVMLPGKDGFTICREIRKNSAIPIIMLTARGDVIDRVSGLEIGADDYVGKPFEPRELVARIQSLLRRVDTIPGPGLVFDGLEIDVDARRVTSNGELIQLTTMEYEFLLLIASNPGKKFSRDDILSQLRGIDAQIMTRSVDIMVSRLRQKLGDTQKPARFVETVWGFGYVFVGKAS